jgi:hypothetical protein
MAATAAFQPTVKVGTSINVALAIAVGAGSATSGNTQLNCTGQFAPVLKFTAVGATAGTIAYVRMSVEVSTTITANNSFLDMPIVFQGTTPTVVLFSNPSPAGISNIAVIVSATPATAGTIFVTPGQGGMSGS